MRNEDTAVSVSKNEFKSNRNRQLSIARHSNRIEQTRIAESTSEFERQRTSDLQMANFSPINSSMKFELEKRRSSD